MKEGLTEVVCVIDRSGSMGHLRSDTIGGFNSFLEEQKKLPGEANLTVVLFDDSYRQLFSGNIQAAVPLNEDTYQIGNTTALLDAIGKTITDVGNRLAATPEDERPERVLMTITTDGLENASREYTDRKQIFDMITHQREKYNWEFIFMGANQDAIKEGTSLGVSPDLSVNYAHTGAGTRGVYTSKSAAVKNFRLTGQTGAIEDITGEEDEDDQDNNSELYRP